MFNLLPIKQVICITRTWAHHKLIFFFFRLNLGSTALMLRDGPVIIITEATGTLIMLLPEPALSSLAIAIVMFNNFKKRSAMTYLGEGKL